ncbi:hypothetical protein Q4E93_07260 [Flavitalea sp. BT771]|uniref:DUF6660 family protein n=1 Tax=Flavitalea sp. BT771 TaxID=3063329 RepID=UPI0026E13410|nr:DUF6660 family protein [Flavitalea sp. BT771]MDO6430377.1 hypothetical protein [Flavitalea sp. BT771]MDV6219483.1 DUF6660 family protein [Flavitalea sp. BT771]
MKAFVFAMAFIVLIQSFMPCDDAFAMHDNAKAAVSRAHNCPGTPQNDACSPFCQCACCAGFTIIFHSIPPIAPAPQICTGYTDFYLSDIREISLPVWQPPQLAA